MYLRSIILIASICTLYSLPLAADVLTKGAIESFYAQSAEVQLLGEAVTLEFLQEHAHKDVKATMHMITNMKGMPSKKETVVYNKKKLLQDAKKGYKIGNIKSLESNVLSSDLSEDGRSARVKSSTYSIIDMNIPAPQGKISIVSEQSMLCDDFLVLNSNDIIQSKESECSVEVNLKPIK